MIPASDPRDVIGITDETEHIALFVCCSRQKMSIIVKMIWRMA